MSPAPTTHPSVQELAAFSLGKLTGTPAEAIAHHLDGCKACCEVVAKATGDSFLELVRSAKTRGATMVAGAGPSLPPASQSLLAGSPPAPGPQDLPPELADHPRFQIVRQLGRGGMGVVYLARHRLMERAVAIKVINKSMLDNPEALVRFRGEVKAAARLQHPNIVAAYDAEEIGDSQMLLVMEYVEGIDLAKWLEKKGQLPVLYACNYIRQAALGLQHAFEQGMVHRDIKPQNLMLTNEGRVKILDFGLARLAIRRKSNPGLTQDGAFMGTPAYVAPEQATDARTADVRADIYSLGCTLYCLLAGRPPFVEETPVKQVLAHIQQEATSLTAVRPDVMPELANIVERMLAKDPAQRFQTPVEVAQALVPFSKSGQKNAIAPTPSAKSSSLSEVGTKIGADTSRTPAARVSVPSTRASRLSPKAFIGNSPFSDLPPTPLHQERRVARSQPQWWVPHRAVRVSMVAALLVLGSLLAGVVFYVQNAYGTIQLELLDPTAKVEIRIDGEVIDIKVLDKPLRLRAREHQLVVTGEDFETMSESFTVRRGVNPVLRIQLLSNGPAEGMANRGRPGQKLQNEPEAQRLEAWRTIPAESDIPADIARLKITNRPGNYALRFDGKVSRVRIPKSSFKFYGDHSLTIEAIVSPDDCSSLQEVVCDLAGPLYGEDSSGIVLGLSPEGKWQFGLGSEGGFVTTINEPPAVPKQRVHLAAVYNKDRGELRLFVNGKLNKALARFESAVRSGSPWHTIIGADPDHPQPQTFSCFFSGLIEQISFSKAARYADDFVPDRILQNDKNTLALYHFNEGEGTIAYDSSGKDHHADIEGAQWVKVSK